MKKMIKRNYILSKSDTLFIVLGVLGLFPFIIGLSDLIINKNNLFFIINIPKYYGSIILTFLGAVYWGAILNLSQKNLLPEKTKILIIIWSVIPSIFGMIVFSIISNTSLLVLSFGFLISQLIDESFCKYLLFPNWYLPLRRMLTLVVLIILIWSYLII